MQTEPPAKLRRLGRWLAEQGVDLVHAHSAHVFQGVEVHAGTPICYDCGDFVDDSAVDADLRNDRRFLFEVAFDGRAGSESGDRSAVTALRLVPTEIEDCAVHRAGPTAAEWSRRRMARLSQQLGTTVERDGEALVLRP